MNGRSLAALLLPLLLGASAAEAQRPGAGRALERRLQLEEQVLTRFVEQAAAELQLDGPRREQLRSHVRRAAAERRELHLASLELRRRMMQSAAAGEDAPFPQLLGELRALQRREYELEQRRLEELGRFLTPGQQVRYLLLWTRLQENARGIMMQRRGGLPPGP